MVTHIAPEAMMIDRCGARSREPAWPVAVRIRGLTKHFGSGEQRVAGAARHRLGRLHRSDDLDRRSVGLRQDDPVVGHRRHSRLRQR